MSDPRRVQAPLAAGAPDHAAWIGRGTGQRGRQAKRRRRSWLWFWCLVGVALLVGCLLLAQSAESTLFAAFAAHR